MAETQTHSEGKTKALVTESQSDTSTVSKIRPILLTNEGNLGMKKNSWDKSACFYPSPVESSTSPQ
jgi:hypothetical protein